MNTSPWPASDLYKSMNGFEELAVANVFGEDIAALAKTKQTTFLRALAFVNEKRSTKDKPAEIHARVMGWTVGELEAYFPKEAAAEDPESDLGKGEPQPNAQQNEKPRFAWPPESSPANTTT